MLTRRKLLWTGGAAGLGAAAWLGFNSLGPSYPDTVREVWSHKSATEAGEFPYLVHYATLAANSHNTQAWRFNASVNVVTIEPDMTRATPAADPDFHHLYASLGCAAENLSLAAREIGKAAAIDFDPGADGQVRIDLASASSSRSPLFDAILQRQCTRSAYDGRSIPREQLLHLERAAKVAGCRVALIEDKRKIEAILELGLAANTLQINDKQFRRELKSWLRFNGHHAAETRDGLYGASAGNPSMPSFLGDIIFDFAFTAGAENDKLAKQVRSSSALVVFITDKDDKTHWVQSGRSYQRFALQATALGLRHAFVNQPLDVPEIRVELARLLGVDAGRPDLMVRIGYGNAMPKSLRRPVEQVMN